MVRGKTQTGLRVDKFVFDGFKELCRGLFEGWVSAGQRKADELRLKGALAELRGFVRAVEREEWYLMVKDRETRTDRTIYRPAYETAVAMLPKVRDEELIRKAERVLEKANKATEKIIGG